MVTPRTPRDSTLLCFFSWISDHFMPLTSTANIQFPQGVQVCMKWIPILYALGVSSSQKNIMQYDLQKTSLDARNINYFYLHQMNLAQYFIIFLFYFGPPCIRRSVYTSPIPNPKPRLTEYFQLSIS